MIPERDTSCLNDTQMCVWQMYHIRDKLCEIAEALSYISMQLEALGAKREAGE